MTFLTLLLNGIQWADKAVENLDFLDVFAIDLIRFGYQNLVDQLVPVSYTHLDVYKRQRPPCPAISVLTMAHYFH